MDHYDDYDDDGVEDHVAHQELNCVFDGADRFCAYFRNRVF